MKYIRFLLLALLASPLAAQVDSVVCKACILDKVDTTSVLMKVDTVPVVVRFDSVYALKIDSTYRDSTVKVTPPQPPPPVAGLPAGFRLLSVRPFNAKVELGWNDRGDAAFSVVKDSSGSIGRATFGLSTRPGTGPINTSLIFPGMARLYLEFDLRVSANFQGSCTSRVNKVFHIWQAGTSVVVPALYGCGSGGLALQMRLQNTASGSLNLGANQGPGAFLRGRWYHVAILMQPGSIQWWVDGKLTGTHGLNLKPGLFTVVSWNPTWGGTPCSGSLVAGVNCDRVAAPFTMDMDNVLVAVSP